MGDFLAGPGGTKFFHEGEQKSAAADVAVEGALIKSLDDLVAVIAENARGSFREPLAGGSSDSFFGRFGRRSGSKKLFIHCICLSC